MPGSTGAAVARAAGREAARALGQAYAQPACEAVLHPEDVIASSLQIPALKARQAAAVRSVLEPMILGDMDDLAIGHGPRAADGSVALAWTPREPLRRAWALLGEHGLRVRALIAPQTLEPVADAPLREPGDPRWQAAAPSWSLATPQWAPTRVSRWRPVWRWTAIACAIWLGGLNLYATQLRGEARSLQTQMREQVQKAYPRLPVVLDPARQARQGWTRCSPDRVRRRPATSRWRAPRQAMPFAADRVARLSYADHALTLTLADAGEQAQRVAETPALVQQAAALGLKLERGDKDATWRITPGQP